MTRGMLPARAQLALRRGLVRTGRGRQRERHHRDGRRALADRRLLHQTPGPSIQVGSAVLSDSSARRAS